MGAGYLGYLIGALAIQLIAGYIAGGLIGINKRRKAAFIGALVASFIAAYLARGPQPNSEYGPLVVWLLAVAFFWWRIGWSTKEPEEKNPPVEGQ